MKWEKRKGSNLGNKWMETSGITGLCHLDDRMRWTGWDDRRDKQQATDMMEERVGRIDLHKIGKWIRPGRSFDQWGGVVTSYYFGLR